MASAKPSSKKPQTTALANWDEELAAAAQKQSKEQRKVSMSSNINTAGGILQYNGQPIEGNNLDFIAVATTNANVYYEGDYNPQQPTSPKCFAFGVDEDDMAPVPEDVEELQNETCAGCWANEWESAPIGRGKACKNSVKIALVSSDAGESAEQLDEAELITLNVPVTSVKGWVLTVREGNDLGLPTWAVVINVSVGPNPKGGFMLLFKVVGKVEFSQDLMTSMKAKIKLAEDAIIQPYAKIAAPTNGAAAKRAPASKKPASKKPAGIGKK